MRIRESFRQQGRQAGEICLRLEERIQSILLVIVVATVFGRVIIRYTPITQEVLWTEEIARMMVVWLACLAIATAEREKTHFRCDLFPNFLQGRIRFYVGFFINLLVLICFTLLIWAAFKYCMNSVGVQTRILRWPAIMLSGPFLGGSLLLFTYALITFIRNVRHFS